MLTLARYPSLVAQFHPKKNGELRPQDISANSSRKIWWKCSNGPDHEWEAAPKDRTRKDVNKRTGCPFCAGRKLSVNNSLQALYPDIAKQWHPIKNGSLRPDQILAGSNLSVWWKCTAGPDHEWKAKVVRRWSSGGRGCPFCAGRQLSITNCLKTVFPDIAKEWDYEKNGLLTPLDVLSSSHKVVWWRCKNNPKHEWQARINNRTSINKSGCPICSGNLIITKTSLAYNYPEIANEWHPTKNGILTPWDVGPGSDRMIWWSCASGSDHIWKSQVKNRVAHPKCPFCNNKRLSITNSLEKVYPRLAAEWDYGRNKTLKPSQVMPGTHKKVWWKCAKGPDHVWKTEVRARTKESNPAGCPFCAGQKVSVTNSLATLYPQLAHEFDVDRNKQMRPEFVVAKSGKKYWWKCAHDPSHMWMATPHNRVRGSSCPFCSVAPRSKEEIYFAHELQSCIEFDLNMHKIAVGPRIIDVDIVIHEHQIAIEYDGSYWHKGKEKQDTKKSNELQNAGWNVIRVREAPLNKIRSNDIVFPFGSIKAAAQATMIMLGTFGIINNKCVEEYSRNTLLVNARKADLYIKKYKGT